MMIASKPGYQLHIQFIPFQSFSNNERWRCKWHVDEDQGVDDLSHDIEDSDNGYTRTKLLFVADIHTNACTYMYNEHNYKCRTQFLWFSLSSFIHTNNIQTWLRFMHNRICVFTMMVLCRQKLRFPKHGRSQVKKVLCFYIWYDHHVGFMSRGGSPH